MNEIPYEATRKLFKMEVERMSASNQHEHKHIHLSSAGAVNPFNQEQSEGQRSKVESHNPMIHVEKVKKPGRNEPCWCGSGKKYKKCHWPE